MTAQETSKDPQGVQPLLYTAKEMHSLHKYFLSASFVPGIMAQQGGTTVNKRDQILLSGRSQSRVETRCYSSHPTKRQTTTVTNAVN